MYLSYSLYKTNWRFKSKSNESKWKNVCKVAFSNDINVSCFLSAIKNFFVTISVRVCLLFSKFWKQSDFLEQNYGFNQQKIEMQKQKYVDDEKSKYLFIYIY